MFLKKDYDGSVYQLPYEESEFKKNKIITAIFCISFILIYIIAGSVNTASSRTIWIVFPFMFMFLPMAFNALGTINMIGLKPVMLNADYERSILRIKNCSMAVLVMAVINIILDLIFIILNHTDLDFVIEISYIMLLLLLIAMVVAFGKKYDKMFGGVTLYSNQ